MDKIIKSDNPYFERYTSEGDSNFGKMNKLNSEELLIYLEEERKKVTDFIFSLNNNELQKPGTHQKFGVMNIVEWIERVQAHCLVDQRKGLRMLATEIQCTGKVGIGVGIAGFDGSAGVAAFEE